MKHFDCMSRFRLLSLLALLLTAATETAWAQEPATTTYKVKMKAGTVDADKWTIASGGKSATGDAGLEGVAKGDAVTLTYAGRLKVKSVKLGWDGDLSAIPPFVLESDGHTVIVPDGMTLYGTLDGETQPYKIVIADGATVTLADATINGVVDLNNKWAGITCEGNATIILKDGTTNTVKGFHAYYPGIYVPGDADDATNNKTLTIKGEAEGTGKLTASSNNNGAGIGGGCMIPCGNIVILGGDITAIGGSNGAAGIGCGYINSNCGDITISGGTVTASGGENAAGIGGAFASSCGNITISGGTVDAFGGAYGCVGIGSGSDGFCGSITISGGTVKANGNHANAIGCGNGTTNCGAITITSGVTLVTATKGTNASCCIGESSRLNTENKCGPVTIGCTLDTDGNPEGGTVYYDGSAYQNGGDEYLAKSPLSIVNLAGLTTDYEAKDGTTLFGTLNGSNQSYKITITDGATVRLAGATIYGTAYTNCKWAALTCAGDATIILNDGTTNTVAGFKNSPGIYVPSDKDDSSNDKTLTIKGGTLGTGTLTAYGNGDAAGIGAGDGMACGNIDIQGGNITAYGNYDSAGIGSSRDNSSCGDITISGGTVKATGGTFGAGIGSGPNHSYCGNITISGGTIEATGQDGAPGIGSGDCDSECAGVNITNGVTKLTATKGETATYSIGPGSNGSTCDGVWIGGSEGFITESPFVYQPSH